MTTAPEPGDSAAADAVTWVEDGTSRSAPWLTTGSQKPPKKVVVVDDALRADDAMRLTSEGAALLWRGDYQGARQLLDALKRRLDRLRVKADPDPAVTFHRHRQARGHRTRILGMVLIELGDDFAVDLRRAPDIRAACRAAYGDDAAPGVASLQELLGAVGAHEWRRRGVEIPALGARIHPHYGVFAPTRNEYVDLVAEAELPAAATAPGSVAFDIGTGTGVLAAVLARRGVARVVATDIEARAVACAADNVDRLGYGDRVEVVRTDVFPDGRADLLLCNPPWVPASPTSSLEMGVFDRRGQMLADFVRGIPGHLTDGGEAWLVLSDLAERLGLRTREQLTDLFEGSGLTVLGRVDTRPRHPRAVEGDAGTGAGRDPLATARTAEVVSLWRLASRHA
ncbi:methyltransferase [Rhodococcus kronopolitis]|uniref:Methyltransferase n=1 Tax=Rhodococcus kronopolitis TaxID=1460226 RepID=A0ABV9FSS4_9NOCA